MSRVWAVARNTIAQALRMKVAVVVIVLLALLLPVMSVTLIGDNTLHGKLQTFSSYGLSLTAFLLQLLTLVVAVFTLTSDLRYKQIFLLATKPVRRWEILLGKFLGVVVLDAMLLAVFAGIIYALTVTMPRMTDAEPADRAQVRREFFTARESLTSPVDPDEVKRRANERYKQLREQGELPENMSDYEVMRQLQSQEIQRITAVGPGAVRRWEFHGVRVQDPNDPLFIRYKFQALPEPPDQQVYGAWRIGDFRQVEMGQLRSDTQPYYIERRDAIKTFVEFEVPSYVIAEDGYLAVDFFNNPAMNRSTIIPEEVQVLYRSGTFTGNFVRVTLLILARLVLLAAVGVSVATWLSFPVAILIALVVLVVGLVNGFIIESLDQLSQTMSMVYMFTIRPILWFLPKFDGMYNPTQFIIEGRNLRWTFLGQVYLGTALIKSLLFLLFGIWVFGNRELAKVSA